MSSNKNLGALLLMGAALERLASIFPLFLQTEWSAGKYSGEYLFSMLAKSQTFYGALLVAAASLACFVFVAGFGAVQTADEDWRAYAREMSRILVVATILNVAVAVVPDGPFHVTARDLIRLMVTGAAWFLLRESKLDRQLVPSK